ncbi:MAG: rRNA synthase [Bacteroidales bacterium]|jgi:23S rRNA pseudouridine1911/1915/1917 synthase|nr:rRNA synthase [Bacteroidales bacterium]NPV37231.1 RluA family pseudouridine synthase [Bacteroidales bacterium]
MVDNLLPDSDIQEELYEHFRFTVDPGQSLLRIDKYLTGKIQNVSRNKVQNAAHAGNIRVNEKPVKPNYRVKPGDVISILLPGPPRETENLPENIPLNIVFEDEDVLIVSKPAGMVVHPAYANYNGTLVNALLYHFLGKTDREGEPMRPWLVHRIDKDTSGLLVVASNELAQAILARQFFEHSIQRNYTALVWGDLPEEEGTIRGYISRSPRDRRVMTVWQDPEKGRHSVTHYKVIERLGYTTLVDCQLETGRTHQIRAHFASIGYPLFGDTAYGGREILKGPVFNKYKQFVENCFALLPGQALHARTLGFTHPATGKQVFFEAPLPDYFIELIEKWRRYIAGRILEE